MNKENAKDYLPLVQALAEGKVIQISTGEGQWTDIRDPNFGSNADDYRIKPEPREIFVVTDQDCSGSRLAFFDEDFARECARNSGGLLVRRFREVME